MFSEKLGETMSGVKHVMMVLSGKGGVGKSTVAVELALTFKSQGKRVGILDIDICGPSIPTLLGIKRSQVHQCSKGWVPVYTDPSQTLGVMSIGFLLDSDKDAVIWRGPKKTAMIQQFLEDVFWGELDVLIIDTPPGTSDEHITMVQLLSNLNPDGAVIVTTPQEVSVSDVRKEISFCGTMHVPVIGVVENMCGFVCPTCEKETFIFSKGGGEELARLSGHAFLGRIPIDPRMAASLDKGENFMEKFPDAVGAKALQSIVDKIEARFQEK